MASRWMVVVMLCVGACGGDDGGVVPDARPAPDAEIAELDATPAPDATPVPLAHTLYLHFDGGTFILGSDDSATNHSSLLTGTHTISAWAATADISGIVAEVAAILAPYSIDVVTARPASGQYGMVVFGGAPAEADFGAGTGGVAPGNCATMANGIGFVFSTVTGVDYYPAELAVAIMAHLHVVPFSNVLGDCMCFAGPACNNLTAACTIGGPGTAMDPGEICETVAPFDEAARFLAAFGAHP